MQATHATRVTRFPKPKYGRFLPRDARSAKGGIAIISRPSIYLSVCNVDVQWA